MGEAKRRGNREQRLAAAVAAQPTPDEVRAEMGFPETAKFHAYVVCLTETGEFLAGSTSTPAGISVVKYVATPDTAQTWPTLRAAERAAGQIEKYRTAVGYLFDNENQWLLGFRPVDRDALQVEIKEDA